MKIFSNSLRLGLFAGVAAGLALQPLTPLRADDHGGGGGGHHDEGGSDDHGGGGGQLPSDDHGQTEFLGNVQALPTTPDLTGVWTVDGRAVLVDATTLIRTEHGAPAPGGRVEVEGTLQADGSVRASVVKTEDAAREREDNVFFGPIQTLPDAGLVGTWRVGGLTVLVSNVTRVETEAGAPAVGSAVRVEGIQQADASIVASEIKVQPVAASGVPASGKTKLKGSIVRLPDTLGHKGNWLIDDTLVTVTDDSLRASGGRKPKVGRRVVIKGEKQVNGTVLARRVDVPKR